MTTQQPSFNQGANGWLDGWQVDNKPIKTMGFIFALFVEIYMKFSKGGKYEIG